jgi:ankyrin repeat protein
MIRQISILLLFLLPLCIRSASAETLLDAAKAGDAARVRQLIEQEADANVAAADGTTALHWAAHRDDTTMAGQLLRAGARPDAANDYGVTPLHLACQNRSAMMTKQLLAAKANPNAAKWNGATPLIDCARFGGDEAVQALLKAGADVNARDSRRGQNALMWAAAERHPAVVRLLLAAKADVHTRSRRLQADGFKPMVFAGNAAADVQVTSPGGFTALMFAARNGDIEAAQQLIAAGAKLNDASPEYGTPLVMAAAAGHEKLALLLLEKGADPNASDAGGVTPLHYALREGIKALYGMREAYQGALGGGVQAAKQIAANTAAIGTGTGAGATGATPANIFVIGNALQIAAEQSARREESPILPGRNMPELAQALLARGADPNARINSAPPLLRINRKPQVSVVGSTPVLLASASNDTRAIRMLVEGHAKTAVSTEVVKEEYFKQEYGDDNLIQGTATPLLAAVGIGNRRDTDQSEEQDALEVIKTLVGLGADVNEASATGWTALHVAAFRGANAVIEYLVSKGARLDAVNGCGQTPLSLADGTNPRGLLARVTPHFPTAELLKKLGAADKSSREPVGRCVEGRFGLDYAAVTAEPEKQAPEKSDQKEKK